MGGWKSEPEVSGSRRDLILGFDRIRLEVWDCEYSSLSVQLEWHVLS